jgi:hypothetical protein
MNLYNIKKNKKYNNVISNIKDQSLILNKKLINI